MRNKKPYPTLRVLLSVLATSACLLSAPAFASDDDDEDDKKDKDCEVEKLKLQVTGINNANKLVTFTTRSSGGVSVGPAVVGLNAGDSTVIGIDYRVQDGKLYLVGRAGGIYTVNTSTGQALQVSQLTVALTGTSWGVDFNPAADRLRIISDDGQNLRHNVNAGGTTAVDDALDYPPGTPVNTSGPTATGVIAAAYTNNDVNVSTATTLFNIDAVRDQVVIQNPPNNGSLAPTGLFGFNADSSQASFDIYSKLKDGVAKANFGFALISIDGAPGFYSIDLLTGSPTLIKSLSSNVVHIALPLAQ